MPSDSQRIVVWAGLKIKDGQVRRFCDAAERIISLTRKEAGCLRYDLLRDASDPNSFWFFEEYKNSAAYAAHRAADYMADFRVLRGECLERYLGLRTFAEISLRE